MAKAVSSTTARSSCPLSNFFLIFIVHEFLIVLSYSAGRPSPNCTTTRTQFRISLIVSRQISALGQRKIPRNIVRTVCMNRKSPGKISIPAVIQGGVHSSPTLTSYTACHCPGEYDRTSLSESTIPPSSWMQGVCSPLADTSE